MMTTARTAFVFMCLFMACVAGYSQQTIHEAAREGNLTDIKRYLQNGADVNGRGKVGETPLMNAVCAGKLDVVVFLVAKGADVNAIRQKDGVTSLMMSMFLCNREVIEAMVEALAVKGVDVKGADVNSMTKDSIDIVKYLVAKGADVNAGDVKGGTPLALAAFLCNMEVVDVLVSKGADVNARNYEGVTPLMMAAKKGRLDVVKYLVAKGADVNARAKGGITPLMMAASAGKKDVVEFLKQHGAKK